MNWDQIKNNWNQVSDRIRRMWGKLSDDDLVAIAGDRDRLTCCIQQRYGYKRDQVEKMVNEFAERPNPEHQPLNSGRGIQVNF